MSQHRFKIGDELLCLTKYFGLAVGDKIKIIGTTYKDNGRPGYKISVNGAPSFGTWELRGDIWQHLNVKPLSELTDINEIFRFIRTELQCQNSI